MIILDTNIISELMRRVPDPHVLEWLDDQEAGELFITTITIAEIAYGINVLPDGGRRQLLESAFNKTVQDAFRDRVLSFDEESSHCYGKLMSHRKKIGKPLSSLDGQIASISVAHQGKIATRNVNDFADCNLTIINPFSY